MRYLLMVRLTEDGQPRSSADEAAGIREHLAYDERLRAGGNYIEAGSLALEDTATLVRVRNGKASATDGPFAETKEHLAGFYLVEARDREEAVRLAAGIPSARTGAIEVRPLRELERELCALEGRSDAA